MTSKGIVAVSHDEIISRITVGTRSRPRAGDLADRELLHAIPQEYTVDKATGIRDPIGMSGTRLETEMYLVTIGSSPAINLRKSVERAGYKVRELVLEPLASALATLTEDEKERGVALVEMGAGTTDLAVFHEGKIRHPGTIAFGGNNVTSDIVHGLGVTQADAERLKERYGCAYEPLVNPSDVIQLPSTVAQGDRQIPRELLAHIIHQRMDEIFDLVQRDVASAGFAGRLSAGVVLTGGAAAMRARTGERRVRDGRAGRFRRRLAVWCDWSKRRDSRRHGLANGAATPTLAAPLPVQTRRRRQAGEDRRTRSSGPDFSNSRFVSAADRPLIKKLLEASMWKTFERGPVMFHASIV
jgi:cell division ATPase FtsA